MYKLNNDVMASLLYTYTVEFVEGQVRKLEYRETKQKKASDCHGSAENDIS